MNYKIIMVGGVMLKNVKEMVQMNYIVNKKINGYFHIK